MNKKINTYKQFLNNVCFHKNDRCAEEVMSFLKLLENLPISDFNDTAYFVVDYKTRNYPLLKGNVKLATGQHEMYFMHGGLDSFIDIFHKDDFYIFNENIFKSFLETIKSIPKKQMNDYIFSYNFRIKQENKTFISVFQRCKYIVCPQSGLPLFGYGTLANISPFKKDTSVVQLIDRIDETIDGKKFINVSTNTFFSIPEECKLTKREKEVLLWIVEGLSTKQIASKINLSENTIGNHRANIMRKTNSNNVAQIVKYAIENGLA